MEHRRLGSTDAMLPEIGLGTWAYRGGVEPIRKAVDLEGFHIDTAEAYGTEDVVGEAIKDIRDKVFLATKVSPSHFRHDDLIRAAENSLRRLQTDHIDLYQLHSPNASITHRRDHDGDGRTGRRGQSAIHRSEQLLRDSDQGRPGVSCEQCGRCGS